MKYAGMIGFEIDKETAQSVYTPVIVEHPAKGDIPRNYRKNQDVSQRIDDVEISNELSILLDPFIEQHLGRAVYATYLGQKWKIKSVTVAYPRLTIQLGGLYVGEE